ncbi:MAG: hypothetical protein NTX25_00460 [Proteobacteria bacterium]|nr:hypothetical protein [Pseudomonadota bacterium]
MNDMPQWLKDSLERSEKANNIRRADPPEFFSDSRASLHVYHPAGCDFIEKLEAILKHFGFFTSGNSVYKGEDHLGLFFSRDKTVLKNYSKLAMQLLRLERKMDNLKGDMEQNDALHKDLSKKLEVIHDAGEVSGDWKDLDLNKHQQTLARFGIIVEVVGNGVKNENAYQELRVSVKG